MSAETPESKDITAILMRLKNGDRAAESELIPRIYPELRRLAACFLRGERADHTLQPTALVNEVYVRMAGGMEVDWQNRTHFFAVAGRLMRRILVDHARERNAMKRGGGNWHPVQLEDAVLVTNEQSIFVLALHQCLERLEALDERQAQVVEMRYFGGLKDDEIAMVLGISTKTVHRDWEHARTWLHGELDRRPPSDHILA